MHSTDCQGKRCQDNQGIIRFYRTFKTQFGLQYDTRYRSPLDYPRAKGENCRFLVWALNPSIGVEDIQTRTDYPYWNQAWRASQHFVKPGFPAQQVGFIIQSAINRGQHQLHIHIGRLFPDYREAIDTLAQNPTITQNIMIRGHLFHARYVLNAPGKGAFTGANPFDVASRIIPNEDSIPEYGILAAIARNRKGIFVLAAKGIERDQLDYRAKQACRLALKR
jgi:CDP-diacylglycerol pyrophosphatase